MPLIQKTDAQIHAEKINAEAASLAIFAQASLRSIFQHLTGSGNPQEVLDELGTPETPKASSAFHVYVQFYEALQSAGNLLGEDYLSSVTPPDLTIFQPRPDGRVIFVAPANQGA